MELAGGDEGVHRVGEENEVCAGAEVVKGLSIHGAEAERSAAQAADWARKNT